MSEPAWSFREGDRAAAFQRGLSPAVRERNVLYNAAGHFLRNLRRRKLTYG